MASVRQPLRIPDDFRDTIFAMHLDPAVMLQYIVDEENFHCNYAKEDDEGKAAIINAVATNIMKYRVHTIKSADRKLRRIAAHYLRQMDALSENQKIPEAQKPRKGKKLAAAWFKEVEHLLNYPREVMLENEQVVHIGFEFLLRCMVQNLTVKAHLRVCMEKLSTANQVAYSYSRSRKERERIDCIIDDMLHQKQMFLPRTVEQTALRNAWLRKINFLQVEMNVLKSAPKRFRVIRAFMHDWCVETNQLNEKIALRETRKQPPSNLPIAPVNQLLP